MKKLFIIAIAAASVLSACNTKEKSDAEAQQAIQQANAEQLRGAVADRDSLLSLVNDISAGMDQIKRLENILTVSNGSAGETSSQRAQIRADIAAIQQTLEQRREQLAALEARLNKSNLSNSNLRKTIETLRHQIDSQSSEIETLRSNLDEAQARIGTLNQAVDSLNQTVDTISSQRDAAQQESTELANELNTCYYVAASSKELKDHKILQTGFLRKSKLLKGNFDQSFFTTADKRDIRIINLHSKKAKVLSNQPEGSYQIIDQNGQKVLQIVNPDAFWSLTNYLVIQVD